MCLKKKSLFASRVDRHSVGFERGRGRAPEAAVAGKPLGQPACEVDVPGRNRRAGYSWFRWQPRVSIRRFTGSYPLLQLIFQCLPFLLASQDRIGRGTFPARMRPPLTETTSNLRPHRPRTPRGWTDAGPARHGAGDLVVVNDCAAVLWMHPAACKAPRVWGTRVHCASQPPLFWALGNGREAQGAARPAPAPAHLALSMSHFPAPHSAGPVA